MSINSKHTSGPWDIMHKGTGRSVRVCIRASVNERTVYVAETIGGLDEEETNARLIAAAPDLLGALEEIVGYAGGAETALDDEHVMERFHAAIAMAKGSGQ